MKDDRKLKESMTEYVTDSQIAKNCSVWRNEDKGMEKLIIGIDLCDNYTQAAVLGREDAWMLPTVICRKKAAEEWYVGEDGVQIYAGGRGSHR